MEKWIAYAMLSMAFAGFTAVIGKLGLEGISSDLGLAVRTSFVFLFVLAFAFAVVPATETAKIGWNNIAWLALSAATTAVSWVFYYKAIKLGEVSTVALIDKGSFVVAVLLSWIVLREAITARVAVGMVLILSGLLVVAKR